MAMTDTTTLAAPRKPRRANFLAEIRQFCGRFFTTAFTTYRPERHYMRGPGPAWRAKHGMNAPVRLTPRG
jgi:hypothetical protein